MTEIKEIRSVEEGIEYYVRNVLFSLKDELNKDVHRQSLAMGVLIGLCVLKHCQSFQQVREEANQYHAFIEQRLKVNLKKHAEGN